MASLYGGALLVAGGGGGGGKWVEALIVVDGATLPERHEVVIAPKHLCIASSRRQRRQ